MNRKAFANAVWSKVSKAHPTMDLRKACVPTALTCIRLGPDFGYNFRFQAGTALWTPEPGVSFGYTWRGMDYPPNKKHVKNGLLPEVHAWVYCPKTRTIVDLTTRYWEGLYLETTKRNWSTTKPPEYLWAKRENLPQGVTYKASPDAIKEVLALVRAL